jgi:transcriptional regulator with XRE-family HTH domain
MGTKPRQKPENLGRKLLQIRNALGLSQSEMLRRLGVEGLSSAARISEYESGVREPSLSMLLGYASVARVHLEFIIDDDILLPDTLPGTFDYTRFKRKASRT